MADREYPTMWEHLDTLEAHDKLVMIDREINKDTELHPMVRWQFRGGLNEEDRKAFLFTNITDSNGRDYDTPVVVAGLAASRQVYSLGLGVDIEDVNEKWNHALNNPVDPVEVDSADAPAHEVVYRGDDLDEDGHALDGIPVPISTPGWDNAPYTTASYTVTHHPETGERNIGTYRAQVKNRTRTGMNPSIEGNKDIYEHWKAAKDRGEHLPVAICLSAPPCVGYASVQRAPYGLDELALAGGLADAPVHEVEAATQPVMVPAEADMVIEGVMRTDVLEPEAPFGESHGYMNPKEYNMVVDVTGITQREDALYTSFISQVTPSESSCIRRAAWEPLFKQHLRDDCNITSVTDVGLHEPLTSCNKVLVLQMQAGAKPSEVWRAMTAAISFRPGYGKLTVAVDEDVDPHNPDAVFWAMGYRSRPHEDVQIVEGREIGHTPERVEADERSNDSAVLWDATLKKPLPPLSLPRKEYMERARELWEAEGLPELDPQMPWYGYSMGEWNERLELEAERAVAGDYYETGEELLEQQVSTDEVEPNSPVYGEEDFPGEIRFDGLED